MLLSCSFNVSSIIYRSRNHNHIYILNMIFRDEEKPKNPMVELFYGRFLAVGVLEGIVTPVYFLNAIELLLAISPVIVVVT